MRPYGRSNTCIGFALGSYTDSSIGTAGRAGWRSFGRASFASEKDPEAGFEAGSSIGSPRC